MSGKIGWIVAAVVVIAAGLFYFWPSISTAPAPAGNEQATSTSEAAGEQKMAGTWRSNTDLKFTREIRADGVMIDHYEGDTTAGVNGEWTIVNPAYETGLSIPAASLAGVTVVKVVWEGGVETTYFAVNKLDDTAMTTTDLTGAGKVTVYTKVK